MSTELDLERKELRAHLEQEREHARMVEEQYQAQGKGVLSFTTYMVTLIWTWVGAEMKKLHDKELIFVTDIAELKSKVLKSETTKSECLHKLSIAEEVMFKRLFEAQYDMK